MKWKKGNTTIYVSKVAGFGKNYGLWIGYGNWGQKVASFSSDEKAKEFCDWLDYMFGLTDETIVVDTDKKIRGIKC